MLHSLILLQRSASVSTIKKKQSKSSLYKWTSVPSLARTARCSNCSIILRTHCLSCVVCDRDLETMNLSQSPCKNCASIGLTPVEQPLYRNYDILNCDRQARMCDCQKGKPSFVSLSNIKSYSCSVAQNSNCDSAATVDGDMPANIRTTASGINISNDKSVVGNSYSWKFKDALPKSTWTCKRCTLLNNPDILVCEACESPYCSDLNSNITPSVIIKVKIVRCPYVVCAV